MSSSTLGNPIAHTNDPASEPSSEHRGTKRPAPRGTSAYPRKRAVTACQVCRSRRTKCDNLKPSCSFCLKTGAQCIQSTVDLSSFDPASLQILSRLDDLERLMLVTSPAEKRAADKHLDYQRQDIDAVNDRPTSILPPDPADVLRWPHFEVLPKSVGPSYSDIRDPGLSSDFSVLGTPWSPGHEIRPSHSHVDRFLQNVHVKNPILDEIQLHGLVARMMIHGLDSTGDSCLVLLICALGTITNEFAVEESVPLGSPQYASAMSYFHAAQHRMGPLMMKGGLLAAQCLFFSGVFMATVFDRWAAWRFFNQSLACCQQFIPTSRQGASDFAEISPDRQAVYWSAWKSELEMRGVIEAADFPAPGYLTYPSFFPTPPASSGAAHMDPDSRITERRNTSWYFYLSEISFRRLSTRISKDLLELHVKPTEDPAFQLSQCIQDWEGEIEQWVASLDASVSLAGSESGDDICKWVLRGQLLNLYEQIYWPLLYRIMHGPKHQNSRLGLNDLYSIGNKAIAIHDQRLRTNRPGMFHRHHGTLFMIFTCTRSALVLLCVASMKSGAYDDETARMHLPDSWVDHVESVYDMILHWQADWPGIESWATTIKAGLTLWSQR